MITRWWWVRHAPTHSRVATGWTDLPADLSDLTALGRLNAFLPQTASLLSSDLLRARSTADALAGQRRRLADDPGLRESSHGEWEGRSFDDIAAAEPELSHEYWNNPGDAAPPGGESWNQLSRRVTGVVSRLTSLATPDIIAVAHAGTILAALQSAGGMPARAALTFVVDPLSVTRLDFLHDAQAWRVAFVNHEC